MNEAALRKERIVTWLFNYGIGFGPSRPMVQYADKFTELGIDSVLLIQR